MDARPHTNSQNLEGWAIPWLFCTAVYCATFLAGVTVPVYMAEVYSHHHVLHAEQRKWLLRAERMEPYLIPLDWEQGFPLTLVNRTQLHTMLHGTYLKFPSTKYTAGTTLMFHGPSLCRLCFISREHGSRFGDILAWLRTGEHWGKLIKKVSINHMRLNAHVINNIWQRFDFPDSRASVPPRWGECAGSVLLLLFFEHRSTTRDESWG